MAYHSFYHSLSTLTEIPYQIVKNGVVSELLICIIIPLFLAFMCEKYIQISEKNPILQGILVMFGILTISVVSGSFLFFLQEEYKRQIFFHNKVVSYFDVRWSIFFKEYIWYVIVFYLFGGIQTFILGVLLGKENKQ